MNSGDNEIAVFLRAMRSRLQPEDVALQTAVLPAGAQRRVPGLRRDEVAELAGVSTAAYTRLEQGRGHRVPSSVVDALASALRLDDVERSYLASLVGTGDAPAVREPHQRQRVRPSIRRLLDAWPDAPAIVLGRAQAVLAANHIARVLLLDVTARPARDRNWARWVFLDSAAHDVLPGWEAVAASAVADLRIELAAHPGDPVVRALVTDLSAESDDFHRLWSAPRAKATVHGRVAFRHSLTGEILLEQESLTVDGATRQRVLVWSASAGSTAQESLALLARWTPPAE